MYTSFSIEFHLMNQLALNNYTFILIANLLETLPPSCGVVAVPAPMLATVLPIML